MLAPSLAHAYVWFSLAAIDPRAENFRILGAYLAEDGRHVLFNASEEANPAQSARGALNTVGMVVDIGSRECHPIGDRVAVVGPAKRVAMQANTRSPRYTDFSAQVIDEAAPPFAIDSSGRKSSARVASKSPFDGSPSAAEIGVDAKYRVVIPLGLGYGIIDRSARPPTIQCFDPFRRRLFDSTKLFPGQPLAVSKTWIRPDPGRATHGGRAVRAL